MTGAAGHCLLTYKESNGKLLTSMTHWVELIKINASQDRVFEVMRKGMGVERAAMFQQRCEELSCDTAAQSEWISQNARECVQTAAPCQSKKTNMMMKSCKKKGLW